MKGDICVINYPFITQYKGDARKANIFDNTISKMIKEYNLEPVENILSTIYQL